MGPTSLNSGPAATARNLAEMDRMCQVLPHQQCRHESLPRPASFAARHAYPSSDEMLIHLAHLGITLKIAPAYENTTWAELGCLACTGAEAPSGLVDLPALVDAPT